MLSNRGLSTLFLSFLLLLSLSIINPAFSQTCTDADGDGWGVNGDASCPGTGVDCDDTDPTVHPGAQKICDGKDNNCDGKKDFTTDEDKDLDGVPWCAQDCDDNNPNRAPNILEAPMGSPVCLDGIDNDCDNRVDSVDQGCQFSCFDSDGDGYGINGDPSCDFPGEIDCNDNDATINPGQIDDTCNGIDNNCSMVIDDEYVIDTLCGVGECLTNNTASSCVDGVETLCISGSPAPEGVVGSPSCTDGVDNDCDGLSDTDPACQVSCQDFDEDGYGVTVDVSCQFAGIDCDDSNALINPGGDDANCNGIDEDCTGGPDSGYVTDASCGTGECQTNNIPGSCTGGVETLCQPGTPVAEDTPGVGVCTDGVDNDCDGLTDAADSEGCSSLDVDDDGDGYTENQNDCNDGDPTMYPGAPKICDGKDNNCDTKKDFTTDEDKDLDGVPWCAGDCDDNNPNRAPNIFEGGFGSAVCTDGIDNDCDNRIDFADLPCQGDCIDTDGDGYGVNGDTSCDVPGEIDCDDTNAAVNPAGDDANCNGIDEDCVGGADSGYVSDTLCGTGECQANNTPSSCTGGVEIACQPGAPVLEGPQGDPTCSGGLDEDCDDVIDGNDPGCNTPCIDQDGDGYGANGHASCPNGPAVDCDDSNAAAYPGGDDANCNGIDEDCVGGADSGYVVDASCGTGLCNTTNTPSSCTGGVETVCQEGTPGDENITIADTCTDGVDNDCDGDTDAVDSDCSTAEIDNDGDGYCRAAACTDGSSPDDCDDTDPNVYPGAPKICDGKDSNCDGKKDSTTDEDKDLDGVPWCAGDCDDNDPLAYPGNTEGPFGDPTCSDGRDNDCQNGADTVDPACVVSCETGNDTKDGLHVETMRAPGPDGIPNTGDDIDHPESNNLLCGKCHGATLQDPIRYACDRCHEAGGTSKAAYPDPWPFGFGSAPDVMVHSSTVVGTKYGAWDMDCVTCHNPHLQEQDRAFGTSYGKYIKEYICFDNPVTGLNIEEIIEFTAGSGPGSFADGPPHNANICEMCHTQTNHHQNDGTAPGGQSHYDEEKCSDCHTHDSGFKPGAAGQSHDTHLNSIKGPEISCTTGDLGCHGTNTPPLFKDGLDRTNTTVCDNCHSPGGVFDGVNDPVTGAKANWADGIYDGRVLKAGKEQWCAGCHDDAPSNSKIDGSGVSAGNITGDNATFGFYITGHGNDPSVDCIQCHDASRKHIDHLFTPVEDVVRVWENPTNYRFYDGKGMSLPHTRMPAPVNDDFMLCFTCHDETWFDTANMTTNFRIENPPFSEFLNSYNLHYFHIFSTGNLSGTNCILCHDPHGTDRSVMIDVAFSGVFSYLTLDSGLGKYVALTDPADWHDPVLNAGGIITQNGPCFNCHQTVPNDQALINGVGPDENVDDGWYLRQFNVHNFSVVFDADGDGLSDAEDNCAGVVNDQTDSDSDGIGDDCDNCVNTENPLQTDTDNDGSGNECDPSCDTSVLEWRFQFGSDTPVGGSTQDRARALTLDSSGNIFVAGHATGNFSGSSTPNYSYGADVFLRKYDPNGNVLWTEKAASPLWDDIAQDVALDSNGNIYVTGYTLGSFPNNTNPGEGVTNDLFVVKFAADGTISWIKELGTAQNDQAYAMAIDSNDNIYVVGSTEGDLCGTLDGTSGYFIMKFDTSGNSVCVDQFGTSEADDASDVEVDSFGNLYIVFGTYGSLPGFTNIGDYDSFVIKYDPAGTRQQTLQIGTIGSDQANGIDIGTDDSIYVAGTTSGSLTGQQSSGSNEIFLIKYNAGGVVQWTRQWSSPVSSVQKVAVDPAGNSYITGFTTVPLDGMDHFGSTDIFLVKYDSAGDPGWSKTWGGLWPDEAPDIALDNAGNHYIAGYTEYNFPPNTNTGTFGYDAILLKGSEVCP